MTDNLNIELDDKIIDGGRLLGKGKYGCTFMPPLKCKGSKKMLKKNTLVSGPYIDKLTEKDEADEEMRISQVIQEIPLWKNYYIVSEFSCIPAPIENQGEKNLSKCDLFKEVDFENLRVLRMRYGGIQLDAFKHPVANYPLLELFKHLLEAGALLTLFGIVHFDLHPGNILVDKFNVPRFIDFNLARNIRDKNIQSFAFQHVVDTFQIPPDFTIMNGVQHGYKGINLVDSIIKNKSVLKKINIYLGVPRENMYDDLKELILKSTSIREGNSVQWLRTYWRTIDSWAIGVNIVQLVSNLSVYSQFKPLWTKESKKIKHILIKLCEVSPLKRIDCVQALAELDPNNFIIRKYAGGWLSKVGSGFQ